MLVTKLFSGFLAAVMVALGAIQIGNNNAQVGEELVSEKRHFQTAEFVLTDNTDRLNPQNYEYSPGAPSCSTGTLEICYIIAEVANPGAPSQNWRPLISEELESEIENLLDEEPEDRENTEHVKLRGL